MGITIPTFDLFTIAYVILAIVQPAAGSDIDLKGLSQIYVSEEPDDAESSMASVLQKALKELYEVGLAITKGMPENRGQSAVILGRSMALASGLISEEELEAVKHDGYVIKASGNRIALAGYAPQGTIYGTYAFLRRVGLKLYPWRDFGAVEIHEPLADGILKPFSVSNKPFFIYRALLGWLDRGRWGATTRQYGLGEFRFCQDHEYFRGKGWLGGDHTAPYLVPMGKYYDEHPEYYAMKGGKRIPKDTKNMRVTICMSNPAVHKIAAERALEWMEMQNERRFFHITDGDSSECECPKCVVMDPVPGSDTDRNLKWVNSIADEVKKKFPNNVLLAIAYGASTYPPVEMKPESNVVVMYCPWYWDSRVTSAVTWANPLNITAMKQFMAWSIEFPDQMGLYDYPDSWVYGQAERIKFLAKNNARVFYACGGNGDFYQWVNAQLLWDPFLNTEDLVREFVEVYYGPAAVPMGAYLRLKQDDIDNGFVHNRDVFSGRDFTQKTRELMLQAEEMSRDADDRIRARILADVLDGLYLVLQNTHPRTGRTGLHSDAETYRRDVEEYVDLSAQLLAVYERMDSDYVVRQHKSGFVKALSGLGFDVPVENKESEAAEEKADTFDRAVALLEKQLADIKPPEEEALEEEAPKSMSFRFNSPDEAGKWLSDGSQADLISPAAMKSVEFPTAEKETGVSISAPLSKLPVIPYQNISIHAGRFYAERIFDQPIDVTGCFYLDFHVNASTDMPITIYVNDVHSDVDLHAGEQIVRIDFRNYQSDRFNYKDWDKKISRIGFDIWPQDNYFPCPEVHDAEITFFSMTSTNQKPAPDRLPHQGKAIWLSQFRSNIPHRVTVPRELYDEYMQRQRYRHVGLDYGSRWISERFRTFTEHRAVSPIFAILTGAEASPAEMEAAENLRDYLEKIFGVRLPVNPGGLTPGQHTGNAIVLGKGACMAAERVTEKEIRHVGAEGFVINAHNGRVAIAGSDDSGTGYGVARYLEDHKVSFFAADRAKVPDLSADFLHELYVLDWPCFKDRPIHGGWQIKTRLGAAQAADKDSVESARELAEAIKDIARAGGEIIPDPLAKQLDSSDLSRYLAAKLLWDPFTDASRLIREFVSSGE